MKMIKKLIKDHKGLSLVELIVTIAIMALVSAGIATAVVSATRNYSRGNSEVDLQQEVQVITNILNNIVIDSIQASNPEGSTSILNVTSRDGDFYTIKCDGANLTYTKTPTGGTPLPPEVLSTYVTSFSANAADYKKDRTVVFNLGFVTTKNQREMKTSFTATSRNAETQDTAIQKLYSATIVAENIAVVEPNQTITIPFDVLVSGDAETSISYVNSAISSDSTLSVDTDFTKKNKMITFTAGPNEAHDTITVSLKVEGMKDGAEVYNCPPFDITIKVRRVKMADPENGYKPFDIDGKPDDPQHDTTAGAVHRVSVTRLDVQNPERYFAVSTDVDYVDPYKVKYTYSTVKYTGTVTLKNETTGETGAELVASRDDVISVTLGSTMKRGEKIIVTAVAAHSGYENGSAENKTTHTYAFNFDEYIIQVSLFPAGSGYKRGVDEGEPAHGSIGSKFDKVKDYVTNGYLKLLAQEYADNPTVLSAINNINSMDDFASQISNKCGYEAFYTIGSLKSVGDPYANHYRDETIDGKVWHFSQYKTMSDDSNTGAYHFDKVGDADINGQITGKGGAMRLEPDQNYKLEFVAVLYTKEDISLFNGLVTIPAGTILWPKYDKLMDLGFGGGVGGANMTFHEYAEKMTDTDNDGIIDESDRLSFMRQYDIDRGQIKFKENLDWGVVEGSPNVRSLTDPASVGNGATFKYDQMDWTGIALNAYQNRIDAVAEVYRNGKWEEVSDTLDSVFTSAEAGLQFGRTNDGYFFQPYKADDYFTGLDIASVFRLKTNIKMYKYFIKDSDGVFNDTYYSDGVKHRYFYEDGTGNIYFNRFDIEEIAFTVLDYNGGVGVRRTVPLVGQKVLLETPTKENCNFLGWYTKKIGGKKLDKSEYQSYELMDYRILYAHWKQTAGNMTLTLNPNGGSVDPTTIEFDVTKTIQGLPTPTHPDSNLVFVGWYTSLIPSNRIENGSTYDALNGADELYAIWTEQSKKSVYFEMDDGIISTGSDVLYSEDGKIPELPVPKKNGKIFLGWSSSSTEFIQVLEGDPVTSDISVLYAFYADVIDGKIRNLPTPKRDGYGFTGWYTSSTGGGLVANENNWSDFGNPSILYAHWATPKYSKNVTYQGQGTQYEYWPEQKYGKKYSITFVNTGEVNVQEFSFTVSDNAEFMNVSNANPVIISGTTWTVTTYNPVPPNGSVTITINIKTGTIEGK